MLASANKSRRDYFCFWRRSKYACVEQTPISFDPRLLVVHFDFSTWLFLLSLIFDCAPGTFVDPMRSQNSLKQKKGIYFHITELFQLTKRNHCFPSCFLVFNNLKRMFTRRLFFFFIYFRKPSTCKIYNAVTLI